MNILIIVVLVIIGAVIAGVSIGIGKLKNRLSNQIRGKVGLDDSNIYGTVFEGSANALAIKKMLSAHPEYTEETIKQEAVNVVNGICNNTIPGQADKCQEKIRSSKYFAKLQSCSLRRVNLISYNDKKQVFTATVTYADKKDDYWFNISVGFTPQGLVLQYATFEKGHANGF